MYTIQLIKVNLWDTFWQERWQVARIRCESQFARLASIFVKALKGAGHVEARPHVTPVNFGDVFKFQQRSPPWQFCSRSAWQTRQDLHPTFIGDVHDVKSPMCMRTDRDIHIVRIIKTIRRECNNLAIQLVPYEFYCSCGSRMPIRPPFLQG